MKRIKLGEGNRTTDRVKGNDKGPLFVIRADGEVELTEGNCFKEFYLGYCMEVGKYDPLKQRDLSVPDVVALDSV